MSERSQGQNRAALILIGIGVVFLAGQILGFSILDLFGSVIGTVFGTLGSIFGTVFGALGSLIGTVFGGLGSLIGSVFGAFGSIADLSWPLFVLLPGLAVLAVALVGPVSLSGLAVLGSVVTGTGLILMFQDTTGRFETWAYLWGLYPVFVGAALLLMARRQDNPGLAESGRKTMLVGLALTAGFGLFFEMIFTGGFGLIGRYGIPAALIIGGYLLLRKREPVTTFDKPKNDAFYAAPVADKPKNNGKYGINPELERQINEALDDDEL